MPMGSGRRWIRRGLRRCKTSCARVGLFRQVRIFCVRTNAHDNIVAERPSFAGLLRKLDDAIIDELLPQARRSTHAPYIILLLLLLYFIIIFV